jgi:FtsH-binding integral membrane protein
MEPYQNINPPTPTNNSSKLSAQAETAEFMQKVYGWMCLGLVVSGVTAFFVASNPAILKVILLNRFVFYGLLIGQLLLVIYLSKWVEKIHADLTVLLFLVYCFATGLTLSVIFLVYTLSSIAQTFFISAGTFGAMSVFGYFTKKDLTGMGQILLMGLFGIIIASVVNLFMKNETASWVISILGVLIFTGLTAYDTQKIKQTNILGNSGTDQDKKESIMGALTLYLDFINLFLNLLRLFGKRR